MTDDVTEFPPHSRIVNIPTISTDSFDALNNWVDNLYDSYRNPQMLKRRGHTDEEIAELRSLNSSCATLSRNFLEETLIVSQSPIHQAEAWRSSPLLDLPRLLHLRILWSYFMAHLYDDVRLYATPSSLQTFLKEELDIELDIRTITSKIAVGTRAGRYKTNKLVMQDQRLISVYPTRLSTREFRCLFLIRLIARHNITDVDSNLETLINAARNAIGITRKRRPDLGQHKFNKNPPQWDTGPYTDLDNTDND